MASGPSELPTLVPETQTGADTPTRDDIPGPTPLRRGTSIARYVVIDTLGAGSMGVVHLAYDPELDRKVAIKLLRPSARVGTAAIARERIVREAHALAKLDHPNVVSVHDVGVLDDRVWIAMEYVDGDTLRAWLAVPRDVQTKLAVLVAAGRGLAAAHAAGFVHRDFKPDNVMVGRDPRAAGSIPRVRVTDFGLARRVGHSGSTPTDGDLVVSDALTKTGALVGTPRYMAPEQLCGKSVDAAADQFAWCVTAFEALWGQRPFEGETLAELAAAVTGGRVRAVPRGSVPAAVHRIIRRGLEREPQSRWATMTELLDALERAAVPRLRRGALAGIGVLACAGIATATLVGQPARCESAAERLSEVWNPARRTALEGTFASLGATWSSLAAERTIAATDAWGEAWAAGRREACEATVVRGEQSESLMDLRMRCLDRRLERVDAALQAWSEADSRALEDAATHADRWTSELAACEDADALRAAVPLPSDPGEAERVRALQAEITRLAARLETGVATGVTEGAIAALSSATALGFAPALAEAQELRAAVARVEGDFETAEASYRDALVTAASCGDPELELRLWLQLAVAVAADSGRPQEAIGLQLAIEVAAQRAGRSPDDEHVLGTLGRIAIEVGRYDEARDRLERALADALERYGPDDLAAARWHHSLSIALHDLGDPEAARVHVQEAVRINEAERGPDHPKTLNVRQDLARTLAELGRRDEARAIYESVLETRRRTVGADHPIVADVLVNLGTLAYDQHDDEDAKAFLKEALRVASASKGPRSLTAAIATFNLANVEDRAGDRAAAEKDYLSALEVFRERLGENHPNCGIVLTSLAEIHAERGEHAKAREELQAALALKEKSLGKDHPSLVYTLRSLGEVLVDSGDPAGARDALERALAIVESAGVKGSDAGAIRYRLAKVLHGDPGTRARALELAQQAKSDYAADGEADNVAAVEKWLTDPGSSRRTPPPRAASDPDR
jgi:tetratricopeptide (TPR) repeat protein